MRFAILEWDTAILSLFSFPIQKYRVSMLMKSIKKEWTLLESIQNDKVKKA